MQPIGSYRLAPDRYLVISDLQIPFAAKHALKFAKDVQRDYRIPKENILCVGDEVDQYFGSLYKHDPNALHTPASEIWDAREEIKRWAKEFPVMRIANSNHGARWAKKAFDAGIPAEMMRCYQEVIGAPQSWMWKDKWVIEGDRPFCVIHGTGYSGKDGHRNAAMDMHMSTIIGHLHAFGGVNFIDTLGNEPIFAVNSGCLIDVDAYVFQYGKNSRNKPTLGLAVVVDSGRKPYFEPYNY